MQPQQQQQQKGGDQVKKILKYCYKKESNTLTIGNSSLTQATNIVAYQRMCSGKYCSRSTAGHFRQSH